MNMLIIGLLLLASAVFLVPMLPQDTGYFLLGYGSWTVEGSLLLLLALSLATFMLLYLLIRTLARMWGLPGSLKEWRQNRSGRRAEQGLTKGQIELTEGNWADAEKSLLNHVEHSSTPLLHYLAAAKAAQQQSAHERRDQHLQLAHESMPEAALAVGLTSAELQLEHQQLEQALATLLHLRELAPQHPSVLKMLHDLYLQLEEWPELQRLLPALQKNKILDPAEWQQLQLLVYQQLLERADLDPEPERLPLVWKGIPSEVCAEPEMVTDYINHLVQRQRLDLAEPALSQAIEQQWCEPLVEMYGKLITEDSGDQLNTAESWLKQHEQSPVLLLALGRLSLRNQLWGKARSYLEACINLEPKAEAYRELGLLLERLGENEAAMFNYRAGLELATGTDTIMEPGPMTIATSTDNSEPPIELPVDPTHPGN